MKPFESVALVYVDGGGLVDIATNETQHRFLQKHHLSPLYLRSVPEHVTDEQIYSRYQLCQDVDHDDMPENAFEAGFRDAEKFYGIKEDK